MTSNTDDLILDIEYRTDTYIHTYIHTYIYITNYIYIYITLHNIHEWWHMIDSYNICYVENYMLYIIDSIGDDTIYISYITWHITYCMWYIIQFTYIMNSIYIYVTRINMYQYSNIHIYIYYYVYINIIYIYT